MRTSRRPGPSARVRVREIRGDTVTEHEDRLAGEEPLEIRLAWPGRTAERLTVTMRTPGQDFALAAGFLLGEGIIGGADDLHTVAYCTDHTLSADEEFNVVTVELTRPPRRTPSFRYDGTGAGSACGVCGKQSIDDVLCLGHGSGHGTGHGTGHGEDSGHGPGDALRRRWAGTVLEAAVLHRLPDLLRDAQQVFERTGGLHAAGLFDADGTPLLVREDIGRHNAVDKVVGERVLADRPTDLPVLCVSGRIGFELVQKAVAAGVGVIAAVGAPSSLAVRLAAEAGLCAVGFVRGGRCVVYSEPDRIGV